MGFFLCPFAVLPRVISSSRSCTQRGCWDCRGRALTLAEHNSWANQFAKSLSRSEFSPQAAEIPKPQLLLDPSDPGTLRMWETNARPAADAVQAADAGESLLLCGQGSAGVDIPFLSGALGETLHAHIKFRVVPVPNASAGPGNHGAHEPPADVTVMTIGDSRHPLRMVVSGGQVLVTRPNTADVPLGSIAPGTWHEADIAVEIATGAATVTVDGSLAKTLAMGSIQSVWMYLGQGYRTLTLTQSTAACAEIDLTAMQTTVRNRSKEAIHSTTASADGLEGREQN